jgi:hypothetical protein
MRFASPFGEALAEQSALAPLQASLQMRPMKKHP